MSRYLDERKGTPITPEVQEEAIQKTFLAPLRKLTGLAIQYNELLAIDKEILFQPVLEAHNLIADLYQSMSKKLITKGPVKSPLPMPVHEITQKIKKDAKGKYKYLLDQKGLSTLVEKSLQRIVERNQKKSLTKEQTLLIASLSTKDTPLVRILELVDNFNLKKETPYVRWFLPYNDNFPKNGAQLLSLNVPLYGNIFNQGDSTAHIFLSGQTVAKNDIGIGMANILGSYFERIGFRKEFAKELFIEIWSLLPKHDLQSGVLYQFFDTSLHYKNLDKIAYVSFPYGAPASNVAPSEIALETRGIDYVGKQVQLRLLMSNQKSLNPFGSISIKRYDSLSSAKRGEIKALIHKKIAAEPIDRSKASAHRAALLSTWAP
jgi:hypothetical protein